MARRGQLSCRACVQAGDQAPGGFWGAWQGEGDVESCVSVSLLQIQQGSYVGGSERNTIYMGATHSSFKVNCLLKYFDYNVLQTLNSHLHLCSFFQCDYF